MNVELVVVGLGYVGLPLAQEACRSGLSVIGFDTNDRVVAALNKGRSHVDDLSSDDVRDMLRAGFHATTDASVLSHAETIVICVPTPLSKEGGPELSYVLAAVKSVAERIRNGSLLCLESTTYPGTTEDVVRPMLESSNRTVGEDVYLAFSPERIDPGNPSYGFRNTPKVVGGTTAECVTRATRFYGRIVDEVVIAAGTREAEMAKLLENTYRHINIALVNEMAKFCHDLGVDLWDAIRCARSKPFGFHAFYPGPGVGGHCIPIDPNYLSYAVKAQLGYPFRFVELAQEINQSMPRYVAQRAQGLLNGAAKPVRGSKILLLGVTYKPNIADERESPALPLATYLLAQGAVLAYHDPYVATWRIGPSNAALVLHSRDDLAVALAEADLVIVVQPHGFYDLGEVARSATLILDTSGAVESSDNVAAL